MAELAVPRRRIPHVLLAGMVAFGISCLHGLAPEFLYDAAQYWGGAYALVTGGDAVAAGGLTTRGVYTAFAYLPSALVAAVLGESVAAGAVLVWNAVLTAVLCAVLIPRLAQALQPVRTPPPPAQTWLAAVVGATLLSGFARFPLVDVISTGLALLGVYLLLTPRRWYVALIAGCALAAGANMRPSLLAPIGLVVVVLVLRRPVAVAVAAGAGVLATGAQLALNAAAFRDWSAVPQETGALSAVQAAYAHVALRYDTVAFADQRPQQWYCDPQYAATVAGDGTPLNQLQVVSSALTHLPESLWFLVRKAAASIHWTLGTPYEPPPGSGADILTVLTVFVASAGLVFLLTRAFRAAADPDSRLTAVTLLAFWFGAIGVLVFATPETRFAVPVVLIGLVGLVAAVPVGASSRRVTWQGVAVVAAALVLAFGLYAAGAEALSHPFPAGPLPDASACGAAGR